MDVMTFKHKVTKFFAIGSSVAISCFFSPWVFAGSNMKKPLPICQNYQAMVAYKMAGEFVSECRKIGVTIDMAVLKGNLQKSMVDDSVFTAGECNAQCAILDAFKNQKMDSCVESLSDSALKGALGGATFSKTACEDALARFGK